MSQQSSAYPDNFEAKNPDAQTQAAASPTESQPSYTKLAMRNMVRKRGTSLKHFALTLFGLLGLLIGLSYLTR